MEERRRQALEEYKKNKDAKRRLVTNTLHHSLRQGAEVNSSPDRLFHSAPAGGRETTPQYTPTRPAKKSSLEKKNTAKTYAEVTTTNVEKEGVDKKSRPEPVNPERDNMQKKVVAELAPALSIESLSSSRRGSLLRLWAQPMQVVVVWVEERRR